MGHRPKTMRNRIEKLWKSMEIYEKPWFFSCFRSFFGVLSIDVHPFPFSVRSSSQPAAQR